jgi:tricarballylate dehydrogenase
MQTYDVIVVGSGNAALCAAIAALEKGAKVLVVEKAGPEEFGGNSRYTAGAMRFAYESGDELKPLLSHVDAEKVGKTDFGTYSKAKFLEDLAGFNDGNPLTQQQKMLVHNSFDTVRWLAGHNVRFEPIYSRQSYEKNGRYVFWGGLTLAVEGEGEGMVQAELREVLRLGGEIRYHCAAKALLIKNGRVEGVRCKSPDEDLDLKASSIILGCGGFEANPDLRKQYIGSGWDQAKVRGTRHNMGAGLQMAAEVGAATFGSFQGCHAVPMDLHMPNYGNTEIPFMERKNYRKICYFLGIMLNAKGERFVDEGENFRNYTYAQFGKAILEQPRGFAWQLFDKKVEHLLYGEYRFWDASFVEADTIEGLVAQLEGVDQAKALQTIQEYNQAVDRRPPFDPTILDGKSTQGLALNKTNWANRLDKPPFKAYPVCCGITFTYGGLKVDEKAAVVHTNGEPIEGLFACGELVGGVFFNGYPGGSGLTSGAVFGRQAGYSAVEYCQ